MKANNKVIIILTVLFYAFMLFLSIFAREIHNAQLAHVKTERATIATFSYEYIDENGIKSEMTKTAYAIKNEVAEKDVYIIYKAEKNEEMRYFVRIAKLQTGLKNDEYTEIISGIVPREKIVTESNKALHDGDEVVLV